MSAVTEIHEEKETLSVDVEIPGHEPRVTTPLFLHSKKALIAREGGCCYICGRTAEESSHPLEAHHFPLERSLTNLVDWKRFRRDSEAGVYGEHPKAFDWDSFFIGAKEETVNLDPSLPAYNFIDPVDPYLFVDDQTVNGLLLCKAHHTGKGTGIHDLPHPLWLAQKFGKEGYQYTPTEILHHEG